MKRAKTMALFELIQQLNPDDFMSDRPLFKNINKRRLWHDYKLHFNRLDMSLHKNQDTLQQRQKKIYQQLIWEL